MCGMHVDVFSDRLPHDDVIKWKHFPRYWPFVRGIHRSPVNSTHKGQWRGALIFSLICIRINGWVSNGEAGGLRRNRAHYDVTAKYHVADIQLITPHPWGSRLIRTRGSFICLIIASRERCLKYPLLHCIVHGLKIMIKSHHMEGTLTWKTSISSRRYNHRSAMGLLGLQVKVHRQCDLSHERSKLETGNRTKDWNTYLE